KHDDPVVLSELRNRNVNGIEVAPTKVWPNWQDANEKQATLYRKQLAEEGFEIPAMQAILFGKPELKVFDSNSHPQFLSHISRLADISAALGSSVLVFGSPKNRFRGQLSITEAMSIATDFFYSAAEICHDRGCCLGMEHNPVEYGCDFITNVADATDLVTRVNNPGFLLHLDSAGVHMCGPDIGHVIRHAGEFVHYHISEPLLAPIIDGSVDHASAAQALRDIGYNGWVSIEMKQPSTSQALYQSIDDAISHYVNDQ
ncbi:MAG: sugar phosphate isomerase/epimerase, partial [Gammaproteobacteria bacterium]|nr:sugar phosphate isomerase/epimerase [Gammaproteobacteria bacterium]